MAKIVRFTYSLCRNQRHKFSRRLLSLFCSRKSLTTTSRTVYATQRGLFHMRSHERQWINKYSIHHFHYILFIVSSAANKGWVIWICIWYSLVACLAFSSQKPCTKYISAYSVLANRSISFRSYHFFAAGSMRAVGEYRKSSVHSVTLRTFHHTNIPKKLYIGKATPL
jgi:hypothetical protein